MTDAIATLWTAVAAAGGAVLGAGISAVATYKVTDRSVSSAEATASKDRSNQHALASYEHAHEKELATDALMQRRLEEAYAVIAEWVLAVDDTLVELARGEQPKERGDIQMRARANASLHASSVVAELVNGYSRDVRLVYAAAGGLPQGEVQQRVETARRTAERVLEAMRSEMGSRGRLPSEFPD